MRFSALIATFILPLSAFAAPLLVQRTDDSFDQLKNGIITMRDAFERLYLEAINPPRQDALAEATPGARSALAHLLSTSGPVDRLDAALQNGTLPSTDTYVDTLTVQMVI